MTADEKREAMLAAECALAGVTLIPSTDDRGQRTYVVSRWGLTRELRDLEDAEAFLALIGGAQ